MESLYLEEKGCEYEKSATRNINRIRFTQCHPRELGVCRPLSDSLLPPHNVTMGLSNFDADTMESDILTASTSADSTNTKYHARASQLSVPKQGEQSHRHNTDGIMRNHFVSHSPDDSRDNQAFEVKYSSKQLQHARQVHAKFNQGLILQSRRRRIRGGANGGSRADSCATKSIPEMSRYSSNTNLSFDMDTKMNTNRHVNKLPVHHSRRRRSAIPGKYNFRAQSDGVLLDVRKLEESSLVDIVCQAAKKVLLENCSVNMGYIDHGNRVSLKAVELANSLRSILGVQLLAHVRDVFGGLLNLLERRPDTFDVVRIPKNDHVVLVESAHNKDVGNNPNTLSLLNEASITARNICHNEFALPFKLTYSNKFAGSDYIDCQFKHGKCHEEMLSSINNMAAISNQDNFIPYDKKVMQVSKLDPSCPPGLSCCHKERDSELYHPFMIDGILPFVDHHEEVEKLDPILFGGLLSCEQK